VDVLVGLDQAGVATTPASVKTGGSSSGSGKTAFSSVVNSVRSTAAKAGTPTPVG